MADYIHPDVQDLLLDGIAAGDKVTLCSAQPTNYTEGNATYALADVTVTPGDGNGDWTVGTYAGGRKVTLAAQNAVTVDTGGTGTHIAVLDTGNTKLLAVQELGASVVVTGGGEVNLAACDFKVADPA